jgi:hypothetical protein
MTWAPAWVFSSQMSSTFPILHLTVPSPSKSHSWLGPPLGLATRTVEDPCCTSSANLGTEIPHFKMFLVLSNLNQYALSHWFSYCLHEYMNEWINGSLLIGAIALKWESPSCRMCDPEVRYKWDVLEEPGTLRWRQSASPKNCKIFTKLHSVTFPKTPLISTAVGTLVVFYIHVSVHCKSVYLEDQRDAALSSLYLFYSQVTLHVSGVSRTRRQEYTNFGYNHWYKSWIWRYNVKIRLKRVHGRAATSLWTWPN